MKPNSHPLWRACVIALCCLATTSPTRAQIVPDATLPNSSIVTPNNNTNVITGGTQAGSNLFHSFEQFSVPNGGAAFFNNALDIQNIISRVTGSSISNIDGLIQANGTANLFLLNPNGIIFGRNASLNIGGSFLGSTASSVNFADGTQFSASAPQTTPLLTISVPIGLQIGGGAGSIINQSQVRNSSGELVGLQVQPGKTLAIMGGDVQLDGGGLNALGGRIELGGLAEPGTVGLQVNGDSLSLSFAPNSPLSNVALADDARVSVRGSGGGDIVVNANTFTATDGGRLVAGTQGTGNGGDVTVNANDFSISGIGSSSFPSGIYNVVLENASGNAGNVFVNTRSFSTSSDAFVTSSTLGSGNAGDVRIASTDSVELTNGYIDTTASDSATGDAGNIFITTGAFAASGKKGYLWSGTNGGGRNSGNITLTADSVELLYGGNIDSSTNGASGNAGRVEINANSLTLENSSYITTANHDAGRSGDVFINAGDISLLGGLLGVSYISSSSLGTGDAGDVFINARDVSFSGGSYINSSSSGKSGDITITARSLSMTDESGLGAPTFKQGGAGEQGGAGSITVRTADFVTLDNGSGMYAFASGTGAGGDISIETGKLTIRNGSQLLATVTGNQPAGTLTVNASESVEVAGVTSEDYETRPTGLVIDTLGTGDAGSLTINTGRLIVRDGAQVSTSTFIGGGDGGDLVVKASNYVEVIGTSLDGSFSTLKTESSGTGAAGDISIATGTLSVRDGGKISASTSGSGQGGTLEVNASDSVEVIRGGFSGIGLLSGSALQSDTSGTGAAGNISITTDSLRVQDGGEISASTSDQGKSGNIDIQARSLSLTNGAELSASTSGQGDAGSVFVRQADSVSLSDSSISTAVNAGAVGNGGDVSIEARSLSLTDGAKLSANTSGEGDAGKVSLNTADFVSLSGANSGLFTNTTSSGRGGDIKITTGQLQVLDGAQVSTSTAGLGLGGTLEVIAPTGIVELIGSGSSLTTETQGTEAAGNLTITTGQLRVQNRARISASTSGSGQGGILSVTAPESVTLSDTGSLSTQATTDGDAGDLTITTGQLTVQNGAQVSASTVSGAGGNITLADLNSLQVSNGEISASTHDGQAGSLKVNVTEFVQLTGQDSGLFTRAIGSGNAGGLNINARQLTVQDGAQVSASTISSLGGDITLQGLDSLQVSNGEISASTRDGRAGSLSMNANEDAADSVQLTGQDSGLFTRAIGSGNAGGLNINARQLTVQDGAQVSASTTSGVGGGITLQGLDSLQVSKGEISASTESGQAGSLSVNAINSVELSGTLASGEPSGLSVQATGGGTAGDLKINARQFTVQDGAQATVSSREGQAGNLRVTANSMFLDRGTLTAVTGKSQGEEGGANITLQVPELLLIGNESRISADALDIANGGNITIDTKFLIAEFPQGPRGSDIAANAVGGNGGRLDIDAQGGIFGIESRPIETPLNDITASSEFGTAGVVEINTLGIDPSQGLVALPGELVDASGLIASGCGATGRQGESEFTVTGRGGLPENPSETLSSDAVQVDLVTLDPREVNRSSSNVSTSSTSLTPAPLVEAQGWVIGENGEVILTATAPTVTPHSSWHSAECGEPKASPETNLTTAH